MRWTEPENGDVKIKRKFAILPISVGKETRWLEWVTIKYVYYEHRPWRDYDGNMCGVVTGWFKEEFIDDKGEG